MKIARLLDIIVCSSNVVGSTYLEWYSGTTYATDDTVRVTRSSDGSAEHSPCEEYVSLSDANVGNYPPDSPSDWSPIGASNRDKMFDGYVNTQTIASGQDIETIIDVSSANLIGLFEMYGTELSLTTLGSNLVISPRCTTDSFTKNGFAYDSTNDRYYTAFPAPGGYIYQDIPTLVESNTYKVVFTAWLISAQTVTAHIELGGTSSDTFTINSLGKLSFEADIVAGGVDTKLCLKIDSYEETYQCYFDNIYVFDAIGTPYTVDLVDDTMSEEWVQFFAGNSYRQDYRYSFTFANEEYIKVTITQLSGAAKCGLVGFGPAVELGSTVYEPHAGMNDYSTDDTDTLGRTYLVQGPWAKALSSTFWMDNANVDLVYRAFVTLRGIPSIMDANNASTSFECLVAYGSWQVFDIIIPGPVESKCVMEFKGLI